LRLSQVKTFYIKILRFADFLRVQIHSWNAKNGFGHGGNPRTVKSLYRKFRELSLHQGKEQFCEAWAVPPGPSFFILLLYYFFYITFILRYLLEWWTERRELCMERGGGNRSVFRENSFPADKYTLEKLGEPSQPTDKRTSTCQVKTHAINIRTQHLNRTSNIV